MILQKFFGVLFMSFCAFAAPSETEIPTETTIEPETTSAILQDTSTSLHETSTSIIDVQQNEIDAKFPNDEKLTTLSDVDKKIESIVADCDERSTEPNDVAEGEDSAEDKASAEEMLGGIVGEVKIDEESSAKIEDVKEDEKTIEKAKATNEIEKNVEEKSSNDVEMTTTFESTIATTESPELNDKMKSLEEVGKILKAHVLRSVLMILNEAKQRESQQQHTSESQRVETTQYLMSDTYPNYEPIMDIDESQDRLVRNFILLGDKCLLIFILLASSRFGSLRTRSQRQRQERNQKAAIIQMPQLRRRNRAIIILLSA
jgi:hypothetical protein